MYILKTNLPGASSLGKSVEVDCGFVLFFGVTSSDDLELRFFVELRLPHFSRRTTKYFQ